MMAEPSPRCPAADRAAEVIASGGGRRFLLWAGGAALLAPALSACSFGKKPPPAGAPGAPPPPVVIAPPPPPPPTVLAGTVSAAADLNPSVSRRPSPLAIRLYELRTAADFAKADFMALYQADVATLSGSLVLREEFVVAPGESRPLQRTLSPETRFIAVFAAYRDVERATWRASVAVQPGKKQTLMLRADTLAVSLKIEP